MQLTTLKERRGRLNYNIYIDEEPGGNRKKFNYEKKMKLDICGDKKKLQKGICLNDKRKRKKV